MMGKKRGILFSVLLAVLTVATLLVLLRGSSPQELAAAVAGAKLRWLAGGFALMLLYVALEGSCIRMTMGVMGEKQTLMSCVKYAFVGFYFSGITPSASGGQPAQVYCMSRDRMSLSKSALCLLLISSIYQIGMLLYGGIFYLVQRTFLAEAMTSVRWLLALGSGLNLILVCGILFMMFSPRRLLAMAMFCVRQLARFPRFAAKRGVMEQRLQGMLAEYGEGAAVIQKNPSLVLQLSAVTLARLTILYLMPFFVAMAFGVSGHTAFQMIGLQAVLTLAVSSLPFPGSVGISEGTSLLVFGVMFSAGLLVPAMLLVRLISFYAVLAVSAVVLAGTFIQRPSPA